MSRIQIYCDGHGKRRVNITTLRRDARGGWDEAHDVWAKLKMDRSGSGERWVAAPCFRVMEDADGTRYLHWSFQCSLDRRHNVRVRQRKLNSALDALVEDGASEISLRALAASL